jgi:hypothetical protein
MFQSTQGIVIALLISLLFGVIIGFYLRQSRVNDLGEALKQQKKRTEDIERDHEKRLQEATLQLQKDYEGQLAEKIELYQAQYDDQVNQLASEFDARVNLIATPPVEADPAALGASVMGVGASADAVAIEQRIRKQYEARLKEAAQKIQQAYEQHLKLKLNESREALQKDYEKRLAEKIEHYQDQLDAQLAQVPPSIPLAMGMGIPQAGPVSAVAGAIPSGGTAMSDDLEARLRSEYEQKLAEKIEHYQDDMANRLAELEQEYEARLRMIQSAQPEEPTAAVDTAPTEAQMAELETRLRLQLEQQFQSDYDHRLAQALERYQDEMVKRTQELEQEYEARLQLVRQQTTTNLAASTPQPSPPSSVSGDGEPQSSPSIAPEGIFATPEDVVDTAEVEEALFSDHDLGNFPGSGEGASAPAASGSWSADAGINDVGIDASWDEPAPQPMAESRPPQGSPDLDDLLTLEQGENLVIDQPPLDDGGFDLDNLEDLLQEQESDENSDNLFDNLDDLSNLS